MINLPWPPSPGACPSFIVACLLAAEPNLQGLLLLSVGTPGSQGVGPLFSSEGDMTGYSAPGIYIFQKHF